MTIYTKLFTPSTAIEDEAQQGDETLSAIHLFLILTLTSGVVIPVDRRRLQ